MTIMEVCSVTGGVKKPQRFRPREIPERLLREISELPCSCSPGGC
ncbi:hypothetical protein HanRHA438_Chr13g0627081 [Helianthus annuus]|nr:hypothetical protein HanRHA438_Chr13g0627081 [Helianthus annuus]